MSVLRYVAMIFLALVATASLAQQAQQVQQMQQVQELALGHRVAIMHLLRALHSGPLAVTTMHAGIVNAAAGDPDAEAFAQDMLGDITQEQVLDRLVPIYAKYLSADDALEIARFYESPTGLKFVATITNQVNTGKTLTTPNVPTLTPADKTNLMNFAQSRGGRTIFQAQKSINEEIGRMFREWGSEIVVTRMKQASAIIASSDVGAITAGRKLTLFDRVAIMYRDARLELLQDQKRFRDDSEKLSLETLLTPQVLVSKENIEESKLRVSKFTDILDAYLHSADDAREKLKQNANRLGIPVRFKEEFMRNMDAALAKNYDEEIRFSENQRNLIALSARILDFAESRLGKLSVRDNKVIFPDNADLEIYRSLYAQLKLETERSQALVTEARARREADKSAQAVPAYKNQVTQSTDKTLPSPATDKYQVVEPILEADARAQYNKEIAKIKGKQQYHVAHILLKSEDEANASLSSIQNGARFEDAAKASIDSTNKSGGDLGWVLPDAFVPPFSDAVASMTTAGLYPRPIRTQFGWHVMRVLEIRPVPIPTFEQARPYIEKQLRAQQSK
ncbi:MAG TPA: peptidylprolyl isomerase [Burkholderiaceae bacterium]|jgi:peptidyl-prolyl cis-trans isomerase C